MKYRVIETDGGSHYPQYKSGFFSFWHYFASDADTCWSMLEWAIMSRNPYGAAVFGTLLEATSFIDRVKAKVEQYYRQEEIRREQEYAHVPIKTKHIL